MADLYVPDSIRKMTKKEAAVQARKELYSKLPKENFLAIEFDYNKSVLLPYDDGLKFLSCLKQAELLTEPYSKPKLISSFDSNHFKTRVISRKEYEDIKIATMLGITVEELNADEEQPVPF
jgi:hypothetical protein